MPEVPQASKALRYRSTSGEPSPRNPQLPMHRLRSCISQSHLTEAGRAVSTEDSLKSPMMSPPLEAAPSIIEVAHLDEKISDREIKN